MSNTSSKSTPSSSKQHDFYGSIAGIVCQGQLDFIWGLMLDGKLVWPTSTVVDGNVDWPGTTLFKAGMIIAYRGRVWETASDTYLPPPNAPWVRFRRNRADTDNPYNFTVPDFGEAFLYWGLADQVLDTVTEKFLQANGHPAYRHRAVLALKAFLFGTERQAAPNAVVLGGRTPSQTLIAGDAADLDAEWQANPWCVLAEILTHPVIGFGIPAAMFETTSWQAQADKCLALSGLTYVSPIYDRQLQGRSIVGDLLQYVTGFLRWTSDGKIAAGSWPHGEAPPDFTDANTIDFHDLKQPFQWAADSWDDTTNATTLNYNDIDFAFNSVPAFGSNLLNRIITRAVRSRNVDRPHIVRAAQANAQAAEDAKLQGEPMFSGDLPPVRLEKATAINPGDIFRITDEAQSISRAVRCLSKTIAAPPSSEVVINFETERGLAELPYSATPPNPTPADPPAPARITNFELVQVPPQLSLVDADHQFVCLAARNNGLTTRLGMWWKKVEAETYERLITQTSFAVAGTISEGINTQTVTNEDITSLTDDGSSVQGHTYNLANQNVWNLTLESSDGGGFTAATENVDYTVDLDAGTVTVLVDGGIPDGDTIRVSYAKDIAIELAAETPVQDFERVSASLTADEVNNNTILLWVFKAADPKQFEIFSVKSFTAAGGGVYNIGVLRSLYGTLAGGDGAYEFTTDDRAFFIYRSALTLFSHESFEAIAAAQGTATFRLTPGNPWREALIEDVYDVSTNPNGLTTQVDYDFADPYAPTVVWTGVFANTGGGGAFVAVADLSAVVFTTGIRFRLVAEMTDRNADLTAYSVSYYQGGSTGVLIASDQVQATGFISRTFEFTLSDIGQYRIVLSAKDRTGRVTDQFLTNVGDDAEQTILMQVASPTKVVPPVINAAFLKGYNYKLTMTCATAGATIHYQVQAKNIAPGGSWTTYSSQIIERMSDHTVYAYASHSGLTDSDIVVQN